ncbi:DUF3558 domain-containing protein [Nocardia aobensis]|uniref:DUF3558 domain-containing protein n=1 Tax=Nocardia aobensis TaxID=257277 RepID=A0ABW6NXR4_9NOCA
MASWGKVARGITLGVGVVAVVAGCDSGGGSSHVTNSVSATATVAADVPAGFDACQLPQSLIQAEKLKNKGTDTHDGGGGTKWRGCIWVVSDGYSASIDSTNITLDMVRANKDFTVGQELSVAGRPALAYGPANQNNLQTHCILSVEVRGGSLEVSVNNPPNRSATGGEDSCAIATRLAAGIGPVIPANL